MLTPAKVVFLLDVDNTLLDNDRFGADLSARLDLDFGDAERRRYWSIYDELRDQLGYADYLGALQIFRSNSDSLPALLQLSAFLLDYPFAERLYPRATATIKHLRTMGTTVILSDGDIVFQPRKIQRAGLWDAVGARVLVYLRKERMLDEVQRRYPAKHYVMIDDKPQLLAAMKRIMGDRLTAVFVRQGHYAVDQEGGSTDPALDVIVDQIGELCEFTMDRFHILKPARAVTPDIGGKEVP
jgi:FMN phosphatase YigB (HAD superfamily)